MINEHIVLPPGLALTTEVGKLHPLTPEESREKFLLLISEIADQIINCINSGIKPVLIFPLKGSVLHYYYLMVELANRRLSDFENIEVLFSYKAQSRGGSLEEYTESREGKGDPEEYLISTPLLQYNRNRPIIVVDDVRETGASVDASVIAYWNAHNLRERPPILASSIYGSVKHMPDNVYNPRYAQDLKLEGTKQLGDKWITAGDGIDGGLTGELDDEDIKIAIEVAERLSVIFIEKPNPQDKVITTIEVAEEYLNVLNLHSHIQFEFFAGNVQDHILYRLMSKIVKTSSPVKIVKFMDRIHRLATLYIRKSLTEA